jgi:hypothetical protein
MYGVTVCLTAHIRPRSEHSRAPSMAACDRLPVSASRLEQPNEARYARYRAGTLTLCR